MGINCLRMAEALSESGGMFLRIRLAVAPLITGILLAAGCSGSTFDATNHSEPAPVKQPALSAEATVQAVVDGLKASRPIVLWDLLDSTQRGIVNSVVRDFAEVIDREVWQATTRNLKKLARVAETKKEFLLECPLWQAVGVKRADVKSTYAPAAKLLKTIAESDLVDQQKMKQFDGSAFVEGTGTSLYAQSRELLGALKADPVQRLSDLKVKIRKSPGETTTAILEYADPKAKPFEFQLSVADGKWYAPQLTLVIGFLAKKMETYHKLFKPYYLTEWKDGYLAEMERLGKGLDKLESAKTSDEFQVVVARDVLPVMLRNVALVRKGLPQFHGLKAVSYKRKATTALVVIKGKHAANETALREMASRFKQIEPAPEAVLGPRIIDDSTVVLVDPVGDINVLARSVQDGTVVKTDAKRKTLVVELPEVPKREQSVPSTGAGSNSASAAR
jgi:hypothetical protein